MQELIPILNFILALGGVVTLFAAGVLFFDLYTKNYSLSGYVLKYGTAAALILTLISTILTLIYSEVFGFIPCGLCWLQRVFLYPQVIMLAIALKLRDSAVYVYGIALSVFGLIISLYQHYLQMGGSEIIGCPTSGAGADCAERILFEFGFMTFPLMSGCLFIFLIVLYTYLLQYKKI
jgi:disulfide bond formation protein DsbB